MNEGVGEEDEILYLQTPILFVNTITFPSFVVVSSLHCPAPTEPLVTVPSNLFIYIRKRYTCVSKMWLITCRLPAGDILT